MRKILIISISILLLSVLVFAGCKSCKDSQGCDGKSYKTQTLNSSPLKIGDEAVCPVMAKKFKVSKDTPFTLYKGKKIYFCCKGCIDTFNKDPKKYLNKDIKKNKK